MEVLRGKKHRKKRAEDPTHRGFHRSSAKNIQKWHGNGEFTGQTLEAHEPKMEFSRDFLRPKGDFTSKVW